MGPVIDAVRQLGATVTDEGEPGHLPITVSGGATGVGPGGERGCVRLPGDVSSQFVSGLLIAGACLPGGLRVELSTDPGLAALPRHDDRGDGGVRCHRPRRGPARVRRRARRLLGHHLRHRAGRLGRLLPLRRGRGVRGPGAGRRPGPRRRCRATSGSSTPSSAWAARSTGPTTPSRSSAAPPRHRRRLRADLRHRPDHRRGGRLRRGPHPDPRGSASSAARRPTASPPSSPSCGGPASTRSSRTTASSVEPGPVRSGHHRDLRRPPDGDELHPARAAQPRGSRSPIPAAWPRPSRTTSDVIETMRPRSTP